MIGGFKNCVGIKDDKQAKGSYELSGYPLMPVSLSPSEKKNLLKLSTLNAIVLSKRHQIAGHKDGYYRFPVAS